MKTVRTAAIVAFLILAVLLARGFLLRAPKPAPSHPFAPRAPQAASNLRLCTKVLDGDTIICEGVGKIRLIGIDSPELGSPGGEAAARFLEDKILDKPVRIEVCPVHPSDNYHRARAIIYLPAPNGGENINQFLVSSGYARVSSLQPCHVDANQWLPLQEEAERDKRGLWSLAPQALRPRSRQ